MAPDFSDVHAAVLAKTETPPGVAPEQWAAHLRGSRVVATQMSELIKGSEWETYRAHLAALQEEDERQLAAVRGQMDGGEAVGDALTALKLQARYLRGGLDKLAMVLALPQHLVDQDAKIQPPAAPVASPPPPPPPAPTPAVRTRPVRPAAKKRKR